MMDGQASLQGALGGPGGTENDARGSGPDAALGGPRGPSSLRVNVSVVSAADTARHPLSCPPRFDPFAAAADGPPSCTPLGGCQASQPEAPRKALADSPPPGIRPSALFADAKPQSCPPERVGRRARPILRVRVKRSLNLPAGAGAPVLARRSAELPLSAAVAQQPLAGCSRKRFEVDLVSPPLPRKSSRTVEDRQAADILARLQLAD
eukprot:scaffold29.g5944.t1